MAPTIEHGPALAAIEPATVIDVGGNKGQFSSFAAARWPKARILAFEPLPRPAARYRSVMGSRAKLYDCALADKHGHLTMHIASREDSSSLLTLGSKQKALFQMDEVDTLNVEVKRLDDVLAGEVVAPALLKIDVQGYEYEVLQGLGTLAEVVRWIYVEASFVELYVGQKLYNEVSSLLHSLGYEQVLEHNLVTDEGRKVQADLLFAKRDA